MTTTHHDGRDDSAGEIPGFLPAGRDELDGLGVFIRHRPALPGGSGGAAPPAVLYVHGATFPAGLSVAYPLDGRSWAGELAASGLDVWALDFVGFGRSSRYALYREAAAFLLAADTPPS